jgi:hypothetical protein
MSRSAYSPTALSQRSNALELTKTGSQPVWVRLLAAESQEATWRLLEVFTRQGTPFEVRLSWSAGNSTGASCRLTAAGAARVCVHARSLCLEVLNLADVAEACATVEDGLVPTANVWEVRAESDGQADVELPIPPFASRFHVHLAERKALAGCLISLFDGQGTLRGTFSGSNPRERGIPLGGAGRITVRTIVPTALRAVFELVL